MKTIMITSFILAVWAIVGMIIIARQRNYIEKCQSDNFALKRQKENCERLAKRLQLVNEQLKKTIAELQPTQEQRKEAKCMRGKWCDDCEYSQQVVKNYDEFSISTYTICKFGCQCKNFQKSVDKPKKV